MPSHKESTSRSAKESAQKSSKVAPKVARSNSKKTDSAASKGWQKLKAIGSKFAASVKSSATSKNTPPKKENAKEPMNLKSVSTGAKSSAPRAHKEPRVTVSATSSAVRALLETETMCREVACDGLATTGVYCRLHYIKNWRKIKRKERILREGKLNQYIEELVSKYPDKYIDAILGDLASDKEFAKVVHELELDEGVDDFDVDQDSVDGLIDSIRRDIEDEGEVF